LSAQPILRDLSDGLVLRRSTPADAQALGDFNAWIHGDMENERLEEGVGVWTQDLLQKPHPTFQSDDFTIVEDSQSGKMISSLNLISQTWSYSDIEFKVGRPELVGTHPDYRNRGLVRSQFEVIHSWSAERGEMVQAITGIPYYYRLFGYEMALNLGGGRTGFQANIPKLKKDETEPYCIRPARDEDLGFILEVYTAGSKRYPVRCIWTRELMVYELSGKSKDNVNRMELRVIENPAQEAVGFLAHPTKRWGAGMGMTVYELKPGISWAAVSPSVVRYLETTGKALTPYHGEEPFSAFTFALGAEHPAYNVLAQRLPRIYPPYAWYLRVPDLPGFIRHIVPVLEKRLADSVMAGHSGAHRITFYRDGLRLKFERGSLEEVETYRPHPVGGEGDAGFPGLTFLQLLFGYRSLEELRFAFADCWANEEMQTLLPILFPKQASDIWPIS
jgi:hypothetical protein